MGKSQKMSEWSGELKLLLDFVSNFYEMLGISVRVYHYGELIKSYQASHLATEVVSNFFEDMLRETAINAQENTLKTITSGALLVYGVSRNPEKGIAVILGPIRTNVVTTAHLNMLKEELHVSEDVVRDIFGYLCMLQTMNVERFSGFFRMLNIYVNGEVPATPKLEESGNGDIIESVTKNALKQRENLYYKEVEFEDYSEKERRVLFYVKNGMVEQISDILKNSPLKNVCGNRGGETLRQAKNELILGIGLVSRAAMSAGVEPRSCLYLADVFTEKAEFCRNVSELIDLRFSVLLFFASEVRDLQANQVSNPTVSRIIAYINENIENKITCAEIAEVFHINRTYVSTCFKKEVGMGLIDYINQQKITRAKYLLKFTNKSLGEITYFLSFSSQAYFTKIFKDVVGMTPMEYKESTKE